MNKELKAAYEQVHAKSSLEKESLLEHTNLLLHELERLKNLGYITESKQYLALKKACIYHDIGKLNKSFQLRMMNQSRFDPAKEIGHNILSYVLTDMILDEEDAHTRKIIVNAVLNHHKYIKNYSFLMKMSEEEKNLLQSTVKEIFKNHIHADSEQLGKSLKSAYSTRKLNALKNIRKDPVYILVKGLLHKCDYSASAHMSCEFPNNFLSDRLQGLGYSWRDMQLFCKDHAEDNILIVGSTGLGKTEASLLWAGDHKIFYVLPLRTAINAMYERIKTQLVPTDYEEKLALLHGETKSVYLEDEQNTEESEKFYRYYDQTRNMSLPLTIATPDQVFDFVFKYPGYELKLATYGYSRFIIDEIQAYSPDILAYTIYAIGKILEQGGKIALFTATLAPFVRSLLSEQTNGFHFEEQTFLSDGVRHNMRVVEDEISAEFIETVFRERSTDEPLKCLVVMNTVRDAQKIYGELCRLFSNEDVDIQLLHAKFTVEDRRKKEAQIMEDGSDRVKKNVIWVTTQIVEASLDIDFDLLFTELSELLGLFQRCGRVFRKRLYDSVLPNIFVFLELRDGILWNGNTGFIDRGLYELSKEALLEKGNGILTEQDKVNLINRQLTIEKMQEKDNSKYLREYREKLAFIDGLNVDQLEKSDIQKEFRNIVSFKAIPFSVYNSEINKIPEIIDNIENLLIEIKNAKTAEEKGDIRLDLVREKERFNLKTLNIDPTYQRYFCDKVTLDKEKIIVCNCDYDKEYGLRRSQNNPEEFFI